MQVLPSLTIIFPIHNGWQDTENCLRSITKLNYPKNKLQVVIIDNASIDGSGKKITAFGKRQPLKLKLITSPINLGLGKAVNLGVNQTNSELILIANNDVVFASHCLKELVQTINENKKIGIVSASVYLKNSQKLAINGFRLNPYLAYHQHDLSQPNQERECDWSLGPCFLIKRKILLSLGGFDEKYFVYFEDIDLSLRVRRAGLKIIFCPRAVAYHGYGRTIFKEKKEKIFYYHYYSRWRCVFKNASLLQILTSFWLLFLVAPFYQSILARYNFYRPMWQGLVDNLKNSSNIIKFRSHSF